MPDDKNLAAEYDDMLTMGGRFRIWFGIAGSIVGVIVGAIAIIFYQFFYTRESTDAIVTAIECEKQQKTSCTNKGRDCTTRDVHKCRVSLEGFDTPIAYVADGHSPPEEGETVTVYFDPKDKTASASLDPPVSAATGTAMSAGVLVVSAIVLAVLLRFKDNKMLQRIEGLGLARDLL